MIRAYNLRMQRAKFLSLFIVLFLAACGAKPLPSLSYSDTILAFGDSLTAGYGTSKDKSYPAVLAELTGRTVINAGISGETTQQGLERFEATLEKHSPRLIILLMGGNDILQNLSFATAKQNLASMIEIAKRRNIPVIFLGVPEKNLFSDAAPIYQELADEHGLVFDNALVGKLLKSPGLKSDTVHLNANGYRKLAEALHDLLQDNGAL